MTKIAQADATALDSLFTSEFNRLTGKVAAAKDGQTEQAFKDHEEYLKTLEGILSDDEKQAFDPNDEKLD